MSNSPLIRTAVNLCLIAAIAVQPTAMVAARGACAQGSRHDACYQDEPVCTACESCTVETDGDLCGCCSGSKGDTSGCCAREAGKRSVDELFGVISDVVPEPPQFRNDSQTQEALVLSSCICGIHSEPVAPLPQRVPAPQIRSFSVIAYLDYIASDTSLDARPNPATARIPISDLSPHFSQRFLCIWRI